MTKKQLEKLIDEMYKHTETPSQVFLDIHSFEDDHAKLMLKKFGKYIDYFKHSFDLLVNLVHLVNYLDKQSWPKHRSLQFLLLKNNLKPLYSAFDRMIKGFYGDAIILLRTPYEAFIKMLYMSYYPDNAYQALLSNSESSKGNQNLI